MKKKKLLALAAVMMLLTGCGDKTKEQLEAARDAGISAMEQAQ